MVDAREWISSSRAYSRAKVCLSGDEAKIRLLDALSNGSLLAKAEAVTNVGRSRPDETKHEVILDLEFWLCLSEANFSTGVAIASVAPSEGMNAKMRATGLAFSQASFDNLIADQPAPEPEPKASTAKGLGGRPSQLRSAEVVAKVTLALACGQEGKFIMPSLGETTTLVEAEYRAVLGERVQWNKLIQPPKGLPPEATLETLAQGIRRALKNFEG